MICELPPPAAPRWQGWRFEDASRAPVLCRETLGGVEVESTLATVAEAHFAAQQALAMAAAAAPAPEQGAEAPRNDARGRQEGGNQSGHAATPAREPVPARPAAPGAPNEVSDAPSPLPPLGPAHTPKTPAGPGAAQQEDAGATWAGIPMTQVLDADDAGASDDVWARPELAVMREELDRVFEALNQRPISAADLEALYACNAPLLELKRASHKRIGER